MVTRLISTVQKVVYSISFKKKKKVKLLYKGIDREIRIIYVGEIGKNINGF